MSDLVVQPSKPLPEVLASLVPAYVRPTVVAVDLPKVVKVSAKVAGAVEKLHLGVVDTTPLTITERRAMSTAEIDTLSQEREFLDDLAKYIESRLAAHKVMVFNHFDVTCPEAIANDAATQIDAKGHLLVPGEVTAQGGSKRFVRQISKGSPSVTADALREVSEAGDVEGFDHDTYLACTTQVRVLDEEKTLIAMRSNPAVVEALRKAVKPGGLTASIYHRNA